MKQSEVVVGSIYCDGKRGARQVLLIDTAADVVRYRILAAKQEHEWAAGGIKRNVIGCESSMTAASFAAWAKVRFDEAAGVQQVLKMQAARLRLPPGELAFLNSVLGEIGGPFPGPIPAGSTLISYNISFDRSERRAVHGLAGKGLVTIEPSDEVGFTGLGWAMLEQLELGGASGNVPPVRPTTQPAEDQHAASGHLYGSIAGKPVRAAEWDAEVRRFAVVVDDFNVRGQREQVNHPGWVVEASFCGDCGASLDACDRLNLGVALGEIEASREAGGGSSDGVPVSANGVVARDRQR